MEKMQKRAIFLSTFGLVGLGVVGAIYISHKIESHFKIQYILIKKLRDDVDNLREKVAKLNEKLDATASPVAAVPKRRRLAKKSSDDEEFLTADDEEDEEDEEPQLTKQPSAAGDSHFFADVDNLLEGSTEEQHKGYVFLKANMDKLSSSSDFWWRLAKATHFEASAAEAEGNKSKSQELLEIAYTYAQRSVELDGNSANAYKWLAITCGSRSEFLGINEKIQSGYKFKEYVDRAISLDPSDSTCYYLLGRFCLEVSMLSWIERKVAATLFSAPPSSTPAEALEYFMRSEDLKPFMDNRFQIAKCYHAMGNPAESLKWLELAASMPAITSTDKVSLENIKALRAEMGR